MYTSRDTADWWVLVIFLVSLIVIAGGWLLASPLFVTPIASHMGKVFRLIPDDALTVPHEHDTQPTPLILAYLALLVENSCR